MDVKNYENEYASLALIFEYSIAMDLRIPRNNINYSLFSTALKFLGYYINGELNKDEYSFRVANLEGAKL